MNIQILFEKSIYMHMKLNHFVSSVYEMQLKCFVIYKSSRYI